MNYGRLIVKQNGASAPEIKMYAAIYDEENSLADISIIEGVKDNNIISFELLEENGMKYMLWADELQPIINAVIN